MRLCFLTDARAEHSRRWARYFAVAGHQVAVLTLNSSVLPGYEPAAVHIIQKPCGARDILSRLLDAPTVVFETKRFLREFRPDVVHAHSAGGYAWLAMLTGFQPYVVTPWGSDILIDTRRSRWNRALTALALRRAALVTCDANHMQEEVGALGVSREKIRKVIFGVDLSRFTRRAGEYESFRAEHGIGHGPLILSTRTLTPLHDVLSFVQAIPMIAKASPQSVFAILGDGVEREMLESKVAALGVKDKTRFVGHVSEDVLASWLKAADVYVSTSLSDAGLAGSTAEAMACSLPVVITDNADNRDWVSDGRSGFLVPPRAPEMLARRVTELVGNRGMCQSYGEAGRRVIEERNNYQSEMARMECLYQALTTS